MIKRKGKTKEHSMVIQLIVIPWIILGIIIIGQIFYGIRVANIIETNAFDIRTATLSQYVYGLQSDLNQYKMFVANDTLSIEIMDALHSQDELLSYQALQELEKDWDSAFRVYPEITGIFLFNKINFWNMINPLESYEKQSSAISSLKQWAHDLDSQSNPYPDSWQMLDKKMEDKFYFVHYGNRIMFLAFG